MRKGWEIKELDTICEINYGTRVVNKRDGGTIYPVYGGGGATFYMDSYNREDCFIVARFAMSKQCTRYVSGKFFLNDSGLSVTPKDENDLLQDFLDMQLLYLNDYIYSLSKGSAQKNLDVPTFRKTKIAYPKSISEQQEIVSILYDAFESIERAKSNAEQNLKNAKELFESYLQDVFKNKGEDWEEKPLNEIAFVKSGGTPLRSKKEYWQGEIPWYSSGELNDTFTVNPERHINDLAIKNSNAKLFQKGSLLIGMYDTAALKMSILDRDASFNQAIAGVKPNNNIDLIFILHSINSKKTELLNLRRGVRQKNLSLEKIKNIKINLPPLKVQKNIVHKIGTISIEIKKLESIYQQKLKDLEELKKSILQKAFNGELKTIKISA
jgi:type I restriction enzyme S subunit